MASDLFIDIHFFPPRRGEGVREGVRIDKYSCFCLHPHLTSPVEGEEYFTLLVFFCVLPGPSLHHSVRLKAGPWLLRLRAPLQVSPC